MRTLAQDVAQTWPRDAWQGAHHQLSRLSALGQRAEAIEARLDALPQQQLLQDVVAHDDRLAGRALTTLWASHGAMVTDAHLLCSNLQDLLLTADARRGSPYPANPALSHVIVALRDRVLPASSRSGTLQARLAEAIGRTQARYEAVPRGTPGSLHLQRILLILVGLQRVVQHPNLTHEGLEKPARPARHLGRDIASAMGLVSAAIGCPVWLGFRDSVTTGAAACLLALAIGGAVTRARAPRQPMLACNLGRPDGSQLLLGPPDEAPTSLSFDEPGPAAEHVTDSEADAIS
jgi:hypothetical protein